MRWIAEFLATRLKNSASGPCSAETEYASYNVIRRTVSLIIISIGGPLTILRPASLVTFLEGLLETAVILVVIALIDTGHIVTSILRACPAAILIVFILIAARRIGIINTVTTALSGFMEVSSYIVITNVIALLEALSLVFCNALQLVCGLLGVVALILRCVRTSLVDTHLVNIVHIAAILCKRRCGDER